MLELSLKKYFISYQTSTQFFVYFRDISDWNPISWKKELILKWKRNKFPWLSSVCERCFVRGLLGIEHNINNYTDKHYLAVLRQEEKKSRKQFNSFLLNYHTIQLSRKNTAQKTARNDNKRTPAICVFTIKKASRIEVLALFTSFIFEASKSMNWSLLISNVSQNLKVSLADADNSNLFFLFSIWIFIETQGETRRGERKD